MSSDAISTTLVQWADAVRVVSMRQRPEAAFEAIADADDALALLAVVAAGRPDRLPLASVATGAGAGWVMAAFMRGGAGRFNDASSGAFYAADGLETAVAETQFHYARFLRDARETQVLLGCRALRVALAGSLLDLRGRREARPELYDPDPAHYGPPQRWAMAERMRGAAGVAYESVRRASGECVAVFLPHVVTAVSEGDRLAYEWDGTGFVGAWRLAAI